MLQIDEYKPRLKKNISTFLIDGPKSVQTFTLFIKYIKGILSNTLSFLSCRFVFWNKIIKKAETFDYGYVYSVKYLNKLFGDNPSFLYNSFSLVCIPISH